MDHSSIGDKGLFRRMVETAESRSIPYQIKENVAGGNDAGSIQKSRSGVPTVVVSVPCRYIHSPSSVMDLDDYANTLRLMKEFLKGCETR
jgi:endoglucanase